MSLYRLLRASAITTLLVKYRGKLYRVALAAAFALVTTYVYGDVALFLESRFPDLLGLALVVKTLIVYCALFYGFWQFRPLAEEESEMAEKNNGKDAGKPVAPAESEFERLNALNDIRSKPSLRSRKQAILQGDQKIE